MAKTNERANRARARVFGRLFREALDRRGLSVRAFCALASDRGETLDERTVRDVLAANRLARERTWYAIANALGWPHDAVKAFRQGETDAPTFTHQVVVGVVAQRVEQTGMSNREIDALAASARELAERLSELAEHNTGSASCATEAPLDAPDDDCVESAGALSTFRSRSAVPWREL